MTQNVNAGFAPIRLSVSALVFAALAFLGSLLITQSWNSSGETLPPLTAYASKLIEPFSRSGSNSSKNIEATVDTAFTSAGGYNEKEFRTYLGVTVACLTALSLSLSFAAFKRKEDLRVRTAALLISCCPIFALFGLLAGIGATIIATLVVIKIATPDPDCRPPSENSLWD